MALKRDWFTDELVEYESDCVGRQIIAREDTSGMVGGKSGAYNGTPWQSEALGIPLSQMAEFNELSHRHGTGARYVPNRSGTFAVCECSSKGSRAREMKLRGVFDKDAGYGDYAGSF
jgi:hypothetical protein